MRVFIIAVAAILVSTSAYSDTTDCQNLYVGRVRIENGSGGLGSAVFLNDPSSSSGSYWVNFGSWAPDDKKSALSILMAAKLSQHRVNIKTTEANGCGIQDNGTTALRVDLANKP